MSNGRKTLVEEGTQFKGSLSSDCPIEVKGRVEGDLTAPALTVSPSGAVHGKVKVGEMKSQGELAGEFDADVVQLSGSVKDNTVIRAKSLEVKLSPANGKMQVIFGECELEVGSDQPAKDKDKDKVPSARPPAETAPVLPTESNGSGSVRPPP
jgi:cytoskeletal protein CcmA (bactofilin family)